MNENQQMIFQLPLPATELRDLVDLTNEIIKINPEILKKISKDQDFHGKIKKKKRIEDKIRRESKLEPLPGFEKKIEMEIRLEDIKLAHSNNRMNPYEVLFFLIVRGYLGGIKSKSAWTTINESITIHHFFASKKKCLPGKNTILENINLVSNATRQLILDVQVCLILELKLINFKELTIDSTAVAGNVSWPTDSK